MVIGNRITGIPWSEELASQNVEEGWTFMKKTLEKTIAKKVPVGRGCIRFKHP